MTYEYDGWGNIQNKKIYAYTTAENPTNPTDTITYGYSTGEWKDQLISYGNQTIAYDAMGNPTTYRGKALTWRGKQLTGITAGTDVISYTYDENGLRLQKTVNNVATDYCYNGSVLIGLVKGSDTLRFSYDAAGNAAAVDHNGTYYYYLRNGQGDVVKIVDGSGNTVVEYTYDSWGKQLSCTGTLAATLGALNPFRYRGYVYDEETQWYYLRSRYYDPETCRFISADVLLSTGQGVLGHNCYAYCIDNPVNMKDSRGCRPVLWDDPDDEPKKKRSRSDKYYNNQADPAIADKRFGQWGNVRDNGCGGLAFANALIAGGFGDHLDEICEYSTHSLTFTNIGGSLGMSMLAMDYWLNTYFGSRNVETVIDAKWAKNYDFIIVCYAYNDPELGAHYFFAENDGSGKYTVYNDSTFEDGITIETIAKTINSNGNIPLWTWGITL